jgi:hypothetical protein
MDSYKFGCHSTPLTSVADLDPGSEIIFLRIPDPIA